MTVPQVRSASDAELLYEAKYGELKGGKLSREQVGWGVLGPPRPTPLLAAATTSLAPALHLLPLLFWCTAQAARRTAASA